MRLSSTETRAASDPAGARARQPLQIAGGPTPSPLTVAATSARVMAACLPGSSTRTAGPNPSPSSAPAVRAAAEILLACARPRDPLCAGAATAPHAHAPFGRAVSPLNACTSGSLDAQHTTALGR